MGMIFPCVAGMGVPAGFRCGERRGPVRWRFVSHAISRPAGQAVKFKRMIAPFNRQMSRRAVLRLLPQVLRMPQPARVCATWQMRPACRKSHGIWCEF